MKAGGSSRKDGMLLYGEHYIVNLQYDKDVDDYRLGLIERPKQPSKEEQSKKTKWDLKKIPGAETVKRLMKNGTLAAGMAISLVGATGSALAYGAPKRSMRRAAGNLLVFSQAALEGYMLSRIYGIDGKVWRYHGAEHKVINAMEQGHLQEVLEKKQPDITLEEAKKASRVADRCGSNLIHYMTASGIAVGMIPFGDALTKSILSTVAGYKLFNMEEEECPAIKRPINVFGGLMQRKLFTREPDDQILSGAVKAMNLLIAAENGTLSDNEKANYLEEGKKTDLLIRMMC